MAKTLQTSEQALIANYKSAPGQGIEALHVITPFTDGVPGLLIMASQQPNINRVNLLPRTALTPRGIVETAAQEKYMADLAAIKTFFGLVNNGDSAAAINMPYIKLDTGGVYWDTSLASFPTPIFASNAATDKITADGNHKVLNYFNVTTGTFDAKPALYGNGNPGNEPKLFLGFTTRQWTVTGVIASVVGFVIWDPLKLIWNRKKKKSEK